MADREPEKRHINNTNIYISICCSQLVRPRLTSAAPCFIYYCDEMIDDRESSKICRDLWLATVKSLLGLHYCVVSDVRQIFELID